MVTKTHQFLKGFAMQEDREIESLIIHNNCGLPVELCECADAQVKYDFKTDMFEESNSGSNRVTTENKNKSA